MQNNHTKLSNERKVNSLRRWNKKSYWCRIKNAKEKERNDRYFDIIGKGMEIERSGQISTIVLL